MELKENSCCNKTKLATSFFLQNSQRNEEPCKLFLLFQKPKKSFGMASHMGCSGIGKNIFFLVNLTNNFRFNCFNNRSNICFCIFSIACCFSQGIIWSSYLSWIFCPKSCVLIDPSGFWIKVPKTSRVPDEVTRWRCSSRNSGFVNGRSYLKRRIFY